jgi:hypothetical protein
VLVQKHRDVIGIGICVVTAVSYALLIPHSEHVTRLTFGLWAIWFQVANWVGQRGMFLFMRLREIQAEAKRGTLRMRGTALWISRGADLLAVAGAITYFAK